MSRFYVVAIIALLVLGTKANAIQTHQCDPNSSLGRCTSLSPLAAVVMATHGGDSQWAAAFLGGVLEDYIVAAGTIGGSILGGKRRTVVELIDMAIDAEISGDVQALVKGHYLDGTDTRRFVFNPSLTVPVVCSSPCQTILTANYQNKKETVSRCAQCHNQTVTQTYTPTDFGTCDPEWVEAQPYWMGAENAVHVVGSYGIGEPDLSMQVFNGPIHDTGHWGGTFEDTTVTGIFDDEYGYCTLTQLIVQATRIQAGWVMLQHWGSLQNISFPARLHFGTTIIRGPMESGGYSNYE